MTAYATRTQLAQFGLPRGMVNAALLSSFTTSDQDAALEAASRFADSYICNTYTVPLTTYGVDLSERVCWIAAFNLLSGRGFDTPNEGSIFRERYNLAVAWLRDISKGVASISGGATVATQNDSAQFYTSTKRGW